MSEVSLISPRYREKNWTDEEVDLLIKAWELKEKDLHANKEKASIFNEISMILAAKGYLRNRKGIAKKLSVLRTKFRDEDVPDSEGRIVTNWRYYSMIKPFIITDSSSLSPKNSKKDSTKSRITRTIWVRPPTQHYWEDVVPTLTDNEFKQVFRMSRLLFSTLLDELRIDLESQDTQLRKAIPAEKRLGVALNLLGSSTEYRGIAEKFGIGISTVGQCLKVFLNAAQKRLLSKFVKFPTKDDFDEISNQFEAVFGYPEIIGVINGCHFCVKAPTERQGAYLNYRSRHSVVLLAICDSNYNFYYLQAGSPGKRQYSEIFRATDLYRTLDRDSQSILPESRCLINNQLISKHFIGSQAFPLKSWLIKPYHYREFAPSSEDIFNHKLSPITSVIDEAFSRLRGRWRRLLKEPLELKLENICRMIVVCCILHNMCLQFNDSFDENWRVYENFDDESEHSPSASSTSALGASIRDALALHFLNHNQSYPDYYQIHHAI